jgi:hypothetical protein
VIRDRFIGLHWCQISKGFEFRVRFHEFKNGDSPLGIDKRDILQTLHDGVIDNNKYKVM